MNRTRKFASRRRLFQSLEDRRMLAAGPYSPPAGEPLSDAIGFGDPAIIGWATAVDTYSPGAELSPEFSDSSRAVGPAGNNPAATVSLGRGGSITLRFDRPIRDGLGDDFAVFENSFSDTFLELAYVEVSSDGVNFRRFAADSRTPEPVAAFGDLDSTQINNLAGSFRGGFGTPFDLSELTAGPNFDPSRVTHVRIVDVVGDGSNNDADGDVIYDPFPTTGSAGFDLDGVGVIHAALAIPEVVTLESVNLPATGFRNNAGGESFSVGPVTLNNDFNPTFESWQGFSISSIADGTTAGFTNQYAAFPGSGAGGSDQYAVAFQSDAAATASWPTIRRAAGDVRAFESIDVANTTYAALSMRDGDMFAKKFGGPSGNDPDFFTLIIEGVNESGAVIGQVDFVLADYRSADPAGDFIRGGWSRVDVSSIGSAAALRLRFESSDVGDFGINTPTYAAIDNIVLARPAIAIELPTFRTEEGAMVTGRVVRGGPVDRPLEVSLSSDRSGRLMVPASVTIPAGRTSVDFAANPIDNTVADPVVTATITASAVGFAPVQTSLRILDNDVAALRFLSARPVVREGESITVTLRRENVATEPQPVMLSRRRFVGVAGRRAFRGRGDGGPVQCHRDS